MQIVVSDLAVKYNDLSVLDNINFDIPKNTMSAIVGPNGAGKSTLLKAKLGLTTFSGNISFFGLSLKDSLKNISYMPQFQEVDWNFPITVLDVVLMGLINKIPFWKKYSDKHINLAKKALNEVGMTNFESNLISELSGGQKQKVFLARAIVSNPKVLFLDEPLAGVDFKSMNDIFLVLKKLKSNGKTIVMVHHNLKDLKKHFDHVVVVNKTILDYGSINKVLKNKSIEKAFNS